MNNRYVDMCSYRHTHAVMHVNKKYGNKDPMTETQCAGLQAHDRVIKYTVHAHVHTDTLPSGTA